MHDQAIILHTVSDAKHCFKHKLHRDSMLFSTHTGTALYLKDRYKIDCACISSLFSPPEVLDIKERTSNLVDKVILELDSKISPLINKKTNFNLNYFKSLYSYNGKNHLITYLCFFEAVKKIIRNKQVKRILIYNCRLNDFLDTGRDMRKLLFQPGFGIEIQIVRLPRIYYLRERMASILERINLRRIIIFLRNRIENIVLGRRFKKFSLSRKTILIFEDLYDLEFLKYSFSDYNLLYYKYKSVRPLGCASRRHPFKLDDCHDEKQINLIHPDPIEKAFVEDIREDFLKNINGYLDSVYTLATIVKQYPIILGIWCGPPYRKCKALIFEYLRSVKVKVVGSQHGGCYGETYDPWVFDSDFDRCDYYISHGFEQGDLERLYPEIPIKPKILPFGSVNYGIKTKPAREIDILFSPTISLPIFHCGMERIPPHELTDRQVKILEFLNSLSGRRVYVKLYKDSNWKNCSTMPIFRKFKNLSFISNLTMEEFLKKFSPKITVIEFPTSTLYDTLYFDSEIFLMNDWVNPFENKALEELEKRVYYAEDIDTFFALLNSYLKGRLPKKRDFAFCNHYMRHENAKEKILNFIHLLAEGCTIDNYGLEEKYMKNSIMCKI